MEILGIGPGEFVLILIVLLVVVGPERLPALARQAGGFLVRARNWLQTSPDAALVLRARAEIEAELASIKNSLMEVQVVRDEVMGAAKQIGDSVGSIAPPKFDLNSLVNPPAEQTIAANGQAALSGEAPGLVLPDGTPAASTPLDQRSTLELPDGTSVTNNPPADAQPSNGLNGLAHSDSATAPALGELEAINIRLQAIMADMWALQQQLKQHGALDATWQPPSLEVQFPTPQTTLRVAETPAEPAPIAEPIEDPVVLAARKRLEELTPMRVHAHAPPVIEEAPVDSAPEAAPPADVDTPIELAEPADSAAPPVVKTRKRRVATTANQTAIEAPETPVDAAPVAKPRKRRPPAPSSAIHTDSAERSDEPEPVTTEKAS